MSTTEAQTTSPDPSVGKVEMNLEVHVVPVSDVDRSKQFYERVPRSRSATDSPRPRPARPWPGWSSRTSKRPMQRVAGPGGHDAAPRSGGRRCVTDVALAEIETPRTPRGALPQEEDHGVPG